jgi:GTP-binding protein
VFIDEARVQVKGGKGGKGCRSFYRDKYTRFGIPDGGDGGEGSDIIIKADRNLYTLLDFKYKKHFYGLNGGHGSGKQKKGKDAPAIIIRVPVGTVVRDLKSGCILRDLDKDQEQFVVASGGKRGQGNRHRQEATDGEAGEEKEILFDLKLIAEVGVVGFPNVGKSTLISNVSNAHPEIAAYPFTTKTPILGVVRHSGRSFVIADIPGLIEGSSRGKGLGDRFLRHVERTKILIHLVDMSGFEGRDPIEDYRKINNELNNYNKEVFKKPQIIAANKMDLAGADSNLVRFRKAIKKKVYPISALKKQGLQELIEAVINKLKT